MLIDQQNAQNSVVRVFFPVFCFSPVLYLVTLLAARRVGAVCRLSARLVAVAVAGLCINLFGRATLILWGRSWGRAEHGAGP